MVLCTSPPLVAATMKTQIPGWLLAAGDTTDGVNAMALASRKSSNTILVAVPLHSGHRAVNIEASRDGLQA